MGSNPMGLSGPPGAGITPLPSVPNRRLMFVNCKLGELKYIPGAMTSSVRASRASGLWAGEPSPGSVPTDTMPLFMGPSPWPLNAPLKPFVDTPKAAPTTFGLPPWYSFFQVLVQVPEPRIVAPLMSGVRNPIEKAGVAIPLRLKATPTSTSAGVSVPPAVVFCSVMYKLLVLAAS